LTTIRDQTECTIPVSSFKASPFLLPWGARIWAKVVAHNVYGNYGYSEEGDGAIITTFPDPPINLNETYVDRSPTTLGLSWEQAPFNGGAVIEDYRVSIAVHGEAFSILA
jgi:hypothetical protein